VGSNGDRLRSLALAPILTLWKKSRLARKWSMPWAHTEHPNRHIWPETRLIERYLDVRAGMTVADIGAGAGYWTFRLAQAVGDGGRVYAIDSDLDACLKLLYEARQRQVENVSVRWVGKRSPRLRAESIDVVLTVDAHLFVEQRRERGRRYLRRCAAGLRSGGRIIVFNRSVRTRQWKPDFGNPLGHDESTAEQVAALAEPPLRLEAMESLPVGGPGASVGESDGYLLVLRKTP
jgi:SAM-dependent methyltransferase